MGNCLHEKGAVAYANQGAASLNATHILRTWHLPEDGMFVLTRPKAAHILFLETWNPCSVGPGSHHSVRPVEHNLCRLLKAALDQPL